MNTPMTTPRFLNSSVTKKIMDLQGRGYEYDFNVAGTNLICLQDDAVFSFDSVTVNLIDIEYDQIDLTYKYLHTVETHSGDRGILLSDCIVAFRICDAVHRNAPKANFNMEFSRRAPTECCLKLPQ